MDIGACDIDSEGYTVGAAVPLAREPLCDGEGRNCERNAEGGAREPACEGPGRYVFCVIAVGPREYCIIDGRCEPAREGPCVSGRTVASLPVFDLGVNGDLSCGALSVWSTHFAIRFCVAMYRRRPSSE